MPTNKLGGKRFKKGKKNTNNDGAQFPIAEDGQLYGKVIKKCGGLYLDVLCSDDVNRKAYIRGALRKTCWMNPDDILLISCRDFAQNDNKCDIIYKYATSQAKKLFNSGEIKFEVKEQATEDENIWENENVIKASGEFDEEVKTPDDPQIIDIKNILADEPFNFDDI